MHIQKALYVLKFHLLSSLRDLLKCFLIAQVSHMIFPNLISLPSKAELKQKTGKQLKMF